MMEAQDDEQSENAGAPEPSPRPDLRIDYMSIGELKPDPRNARLHSKKQIRQIAASIESFGFNVPILIDAAGQVICGHGRLAAAARLGWAKSLRSRSNI